MKGLLLNEFYSAVGNIKLFLFIALAAALSLIITGSPTAQELFVYITITALSVNAVVSFRKNAVFKWDKYELTMPVHRKDIIRSKYLSYLFWLLFGTLLALTVTILAAIIHKTTTWLPGTGALPSMFTLGIGISLLTGALFYPLSFVFGIEKSETILIISIITAILLSIVTLNILNRYLPSFSTRMTVFILLYTASFAVSYRITLLLYLKKEF